MKINRKERKSEEENENTIYYANAQCCALKGKQFQMNEMTNPKNQPMKNNKYPKAPGKATGLTEKHYILLLLNTIGTSTDSQLPISSSGRQGWT